MKDFGHKNPLSAKTAHSLSLSCCIPDHQPSLYLLVSELFVLYTFLVWVKVCSYCTGISIVAIPAGPGARQMHKTQPLSNCLFISSPSFAVSRCLYSCHHALKVTVHIMNSLLLSCRSKKSFPVLPLSFFIKVKFSPLSFMHTPGKLTPQCCWFEFLRFTALCSVSHWVGCHSGSDTSSWETIWSHALLLSPTCY